MGKGRKHRSVPLWRPTIVLAAGLEEAIERRRPRDLPVSEQERRKRLTRSNVTQRLDLAVVRATKSQPGLAGRSISPHTIRHTTAMHMLHAGVDITVIALWLGHESPATTHMYLEADLSMKERDSRPVATDRSHEHAISAAGSTDAVPPEPLNYVHFVGA